MTPSGTQDGRVPNVMGGPPRTIAACGTQEIAQVVEVLDEGAAALVEVDGAQRRATVAVSCLVRPFAGDRVLVLVHGDEVFVLGVLERPAPNYAMLALPGRGNLSIEGETVAITSRQRTALRADALDIRATSMTVAVEKTTWLGRVFTLVVDRLRSSAKTQEQTADTLTTKAVDRVTIVDRADSLEAGTQSIRIDSVAAMTAQSAVVAVADDLRFDGKRVSVG